MNKILVLVILISLFATIACDQEKYKQGKVIYDTLCLNCHMANGDGLGELYPPLSNSKYLTIQKAELPCLIRTGVRSDQLSTVYMPSHPNIEEASMTNLINYLVHQWGDQKPVKLSDVVDQIELCEK